jgi:hypothetical protein
VKKIKNRKLDRKLVETADLIVCFWLVHHEHNPATYESGVIGLLKKLIDDSTGSE